MTVAAIIGWACLRPTQITVRLTTDVPCTSLMGTSIYNGSGADGVPVTTTRDCVEGAPHTVGTLVLAPSGNDNSALVTITTVAGVNVRAEECTAANQWSGCIVARRKLRYERHEPLDLPIFLASACRDFACGEDETCVPCAKEPCAKGAVPLCAPAEAVDRCAEPGANCRAASSDGGRGSADGTVDPSDGATGDAAPVADAGTPTFVRLVPSPAGEHVYGLAFHAERLYWTTGKALWSARLVTLLLSDGDAGAQEPAPAGNEFRGLDVNDAGIALAGRWAASKCGSVFPHGYPDAATLLPCLSGSPLGIAFFPRGEATLGVRTFHLDGLSSWSLDGGTGSGKVFCGTSYIRTAFGSPLAASKEVVNGVNSTGPTIGSDPDPTGLAACTQDIGPGEVLIAGAVTSKFDRYVTTTSGRLFRQLNGTQTWMQIAELPGAADILAVDSAQPGRAHVLVAADDGIWIARDVKDGP